MRFILTAGWEDGIADLTECLARNLAGGKKVLWLLSGGSNLPASVEVMDNVSAALSKNLTVSLIDERFGEEGHPDSNWTKLLAAGFDVKQGSLLPILKPGLNFEQTVERFQKILKDGRENNQTVIVQLGIGEDGHVAGILPDSPAALEKKDLVCGYQSQPFLRLTATFPAIKKADIIYAFAFGSNKQAALVSLQSKKISPIKQPDQILKQIPKAFIYNDQVGDTA